MWLIKTPQQLCDLHIVQGDVSDKLQQPQQAELLCTPRPQRDSSSVANGHELQQTHLSEGVADDGAVEKETQVVEQPQAPETETSVKQHFATPATLSQLFFALLLQAEEIASLDAGARNCCNAVLRHVGGLLFPCNATTPLWFDLIACTQLRLLRVDAKLPATGDFKTIASFIQRHHESLAHTHVLAQTQMHASPELTEEIGALNGIVDILSVNQSVWLTDTSQLSNVRDLRLGYCYSLSKLSSFSVLHTLKVSHCDSLLEVSGLRDLHRLVLMNCNGITAISNLRRIRVLTISWCLNLRKLEDVDESYQVLALMCSRLRAVANVRNSVAVHLVSCKELADVSSLENLRFIKIHNASSFESAEGLSSVHSVALAICPRLSNVAPLGSVHTLQLMSCPGVTDVSSLAHVNTLTLQQCSRIKNASVLTAPVPHLTITS